MQGAVRFKRVHNRTAEDIYRNMIRPRLPMALDDVAQKIVYHARHNHQYENRTGALEESVSWVGAKIRGNRVTAIIMAGGESKATKTYRQEKVFYIDEQGRLRVFKLKTAKVTAKGTPVYVDYAIWAELKGLRVLKFAIEKFRRQIAKILGRNLKIKAAPRFHTFKSGKRANVAGGL